MSDFSASTADAPASLSTRIKQSFTASVGDIIFGMEDGTVSIFGLVFGVAASSTTSAPVLLAGATGAVAAAVSMMAGAYLEVQSSRGQAQAQMAHELSELKTRPHEEQQEVLRRLREQGFNEQDAGGMLGIMQRNPEAMLRFESAFELELGKAAKENPIAHAAWMFLADVVAATIPVIPFALFSLDTARVVSLVLTATLLLLLGIGRGLIAQTNLVMTTIQTLVVAAAAAAAGIFIGKLLGVSASG